MMLSIEQEGKISVYTPASAGDVKMAKGGDWS